MAKDARYSIVKTALEKGAVKKLEEIFILLTPTLIRNDVGIGHVAINNRGKSSGKYRIEELVKLAEMIGCDPMMLLEMAYKEYANKQNR